MIYESHNQRKFREVIRKEEKLGVIGGAGLLVLYGIAVGIGYLGKHNDTHRNDTSFTNRLHNIEVKVR